MIPLYIRFDFSDPKSAVRFRECRAAAIWVSVPETPVHKEGYF